MSQSMVLEDLEWPSDARTALEELAKTGKRFDAYDLTKADLRNPPNSHMWGALFRQAAADGVITEVGFHKSSRPGRAMGVCRIWTGTAIYRRAA